MVRVAILEGDPRQTQLLQDYLHRYGEEHREQFAISCFENGIPFISNYQANYDIVLMDVEMPYMDGISVAHKLRELDQVAVLIFITNLAQNACKGYEVDAMDYLVKPVPYPVFALRMTKALRRVSRQAQWQMFATEDGMVRIRYSVIQYVESQDHWMVFHTAEGEYRIRSTMAKMEELLLPHHFSRASRFFLLNLAHIEAVGTGDVTVAGHKILLGRLYKKQFLNDLTVFLGERVCHG